MRKAEVDPAQKTITAQGDALWADVDEAAAEHGLATVGGTVNHTGIGGLTLGGGYGWLTGAYGLTIDNLLEAELVLADGSIVTASHTENEDLFWAVRGAGACFGVATKFVYRAHEQKNQI
jgi:FAD/FMN-containing dehydrogenase